MTTYLHLAGPIRRVLCLALAMTTATAPSLSAWAQTNAAVMAVRQRAEGLQGAPGPEGQPTQPPQSSPGPGPGQPISVEPTAGKIDTRYILPTAAAVVVVRPCRSLLRRWLKRFLSKSPRPSD